MLLIGVLVPVSGSYSPREVEQAFGEELRLIARRAGLDDSRDSEILRRELFSLFGDPPDVPDKAAGALEILHADAVSSLTEDDRRMLTFRGSVDLLLHGEQPVRLRSDLVLLDQSRGILYAYGTVSTEDSQLIPAESFQADSVILSLEGQTGAAVKPAAVFLQDDETFYLDGGAVTFRRQDDIIIEDGVLSTRAEDPYFSIRASRLHLLPSGDITLRNAALYLGRVPVMFLPFFYYPSRTFVFNPVVGFDSQRGYFSQNTLYLSGAPEPREDDESANLFRFFLDPDDEAESLVHDWYSRTYQPEENGQPEGFRRLMVDVYSGTETEPAEVFTGFALYNPDPVWLDRFSLQGGLSFGAKRQAEELPFGYEQYGGCFDLQAGYRSGNFSANLQLPYMTQREFTRDFLNRFEHFSFQHLFDDQTEWPAEHRLPSSQLWKLDASYSFRNPSGSVIEQFRLNELSGALSWRLTDTEGIRHFDPYTVTAPRLSYRVSGTLFDIEGTRREAQPQEAQGPEVPAVYAADIASPLMVPEIQDDEAPESLLSDRSVPSVQTPRAPPADRLSMSYVWDHDASMITPLQEDDPLKFARITSRLNHTLSTQLRGFSSLIDASSSLRTRFHYYDHPFGETQSSDRYSTYVNLLHDLRIAFPAAQVTYRLDTELFYDRFLFEDDALRNRRTFAWDDTQVKRHEIFHERKYPLNEAGDTLDARLTLRLPPLEVSLAPRLTYTRGDFSLRGESWFSWDEQPEVLESSMLAQYRRDADRLISQQLKVDHQLQEWEGETRLNLKFADLRTTHQLRFGNTHPYHDLGPYRITADYRDTSLRVVSDWIDDGDQYAPAQLRFSHLQEFPNLTFWKDRIRFTSGISTNLLVDRQQEYQDRFGFSLHAGFRIEEFLDISFRSASYHRNPRKYLDDPGSFLPDLMDSFGSSEDRRSSPFNIDAYEIGLVHYMPDWNLHAELTGNVERSGNEWNLEHRLHVYLQWKHIPELRTDHRSEF